MIAHDPMAEECSRIPEQVRAFFQADGVLAKSSVSEADNFAFEARPQQMAMAAAVAEAILKPQHLAVEAGTGVGKTFAYLVPLILLAKDKNGRWPYLLIPSTSRNSWSLRIFPFSGTTWALGF